MSWNDRKTHKETVLQKLFGHRSNLIKLSDATKFGNANIVNLVQIRRVGHWNKLLQKTGKFLDTNLTGCKLGIILIVKSSD